MLINAITNAVGNLADGAKKFEDLDADHPKLVGGGLKELTGPIMDLAKGGIVANFVGSGAFENQMVIENLKVLIPNYTCSWIPVINKFTQRNECILQETVC